MNTELHNCLLWILQRGITEARALSLTGEVKKAADLLDALDNLPTYLREWEEDSKAKIVRQFDTFSKLYPDHCTDYLGKIKEVGE